MIIFHVPSDSMLMGRYMFHCHILEHEDHDMMRPFDVVPGSAACFVFSSRGRAEIFLRQRRALAP